MEFFPDKEQGEPMTDADSNLWSDSEDERRFAIIEASRTRDSSKLPRLLTLLHTDTYPTGDTSREPWGALVEMKPSGLYLNSLSERKVSFWVT